jgi:hypothetical protein
MALNFFETVKRTGHGSTYWQTAFSPSRFLQCKITDHWSKEISSVMKLPDPMCSLWWPLAHIKQRKTIKNRYVHYKVKKNISTILMTS